MLRNLAKQGFDCKHIVTACGSCRDGLERLHMETQFPQLTLRDVGQLTLPLLDKNKLGLVEGSKVVHCRACHCEWADVQIKGKNRSSRSAGRFQWGRYFLNPGCCGESGMEP